MDWRVESSNEYFSEVYGGWLAGGNPTRIPHGGKYFDMRNYMSNGCPISMEFVRPEDVEAEESTPGLSRQVVFETEQNVMVRSSVDSGSSTGWHHHCDRHAFGYVLIGKGTVEFGPGGREERAVNAPLCFHIPPGIIHREIADTDMEVVVNFVGQGPLFENVDAP